MTAKVTLSFADQTLADARALAKRDGVSLSAWIDRATRERCAREIFAAHADAVRRTALYTEAAVLADEQDDARVEAALRGRAPR